MPARLPCTCATDGVGAFWEEPWPRRDSTKLPAARLARAQAAFACATNWPAPTWPAPVCPAGVCAVEPVVPDVPEVAAPPVVTVAGALAAAGEDEPAVELPAPSLQPASANASAQAAAIVAVFVSLALMAARGGRSGHRRLAPYEARPGSIRAVSDSGGP